MSYPPPPGDRGAYHPRPSEHSSTAPPSSSSAPGHHLPPLATADHGAAHPHPHSHGHPPPPSQPYHPPPPSGDQGYYARPEHPSHYPPPAQAGPSGQYPAPPPAQHHESEYQRGREWPPPPSAHHHAGPHAPAASSAPYPPSAAPAPYPPSSGPPVNGHPAPAAAPYPHHHPPPAGHYPPPASYGPPPPAGSHAPPSHYPPASAPPHGAPPHDPNYPHLPPPGHGYPPHYDPYYRAAYDGRGHPHGYPPPPHQAPRQRTAIACKYCRKRKIRCSGFESPEGRCTNCVRFSQECVFAPVASQQAQTFVPYAAYERLNRGNDSAPLYGAYGQPLRTDPGYDARHPPPPPGVYPHPPAGYPGPAYNGQPPHPYPPPYGGQHPPPSDPRYAPPPAHAHGHPPPAHPAAAAAASALAPPRSPADQSARKRGAEDDLSPHLPPPNPGAASNLPRTSAPEHNPEYKHLDVTSVAHRTQSPTAGHSPHHSTAQAGPPPHGYYPSHSSHHARSEPPRAQSPYGAVSGRPHTSTPPNNTTSAPNGAYPGGYSHTSNGANGSHKAEGHSTTSPATPSSTTQPTTYASSNTPANNASVASQGRQSPGSATQKSPTSANANGRAGMSLSNMLGPADGDKRSPDIDASMKARLGSSQAYASKA